MAVRDVLAYEPFVVLPSAARTATPTVDEFRVRGGDSDGLLVVVNVTAVADTPSVVFTIRGVDMVSGSTWVVLTSAAIVGTGTTVLRVHPSLTAATNVTAKDVVPAFWTITAVHGDADSITYSVAAQLV
jgi:hypothetical protein